MRRASLLAILFGAGALFWFMRARASNIEEGDDVALPIEDTVTSNAMDGAIIAGGADPEKNVLALLALIRKFETNDRYNVIFGGQTFASYADHPRIRVPINLPGYEGKYSTAAGAYQFLESTWDRLASRLQLADFSPASQDAAAIGLLDEVGALAPAQAGDFDTALRLASSQWASLPYSAAKQHPKTIAAANDFLASYMA